MRPRRDRDLSFSDLDKTETLDFLSRDETDTLLGRDRDLLARAIMASF